MRRDKAKAIYLTEFERGIVLHALRIANEDGSIYGEWNGEPESQEYQKINAAIERIEAML